MLFVDEIWHHGKFKFIPDKVINFLLRKFSFYLFDKMIKKGENFEGSPYEKKVLEKPDFYEWIDIKVNKYFYNK